MKVRTFRFIRLPLQVLFWVNYIRSIISLLVSHTRIPVWWIQFEGWKKSTDFSLLHPNKFQNCLWTGISWSPKLFTNQLTGKLRFDQKLHPNQFQKSSQITLVIKSPVEPEEIGSLLKLKICLAFFLSTGAKTQFPIIQKLSFYDIFEFK